MWSYLLCGGDFQPTGGHILWSTGNRTLGYRMGSRFSKSFLAQPFLGLDFHCFPRNTYHKGTHPSCLVGVPCGAFINARNVCQNQGVHIGRRQRAVGSLVTLVVRTFLVKIRDSPRQDGASSVHGPQRKVGTQEEQAGDTAAFKVLSVQLGVEPEEIILSCI